MAQSDDNRPDPQAGERSSFRRAFTELLSEWVVAPLKSYSLTSLRLFKHPRSFAEGIAAGKHTVKEPVQYYFISWAVGTSIGKALGVEIFSPNYGVSVDELIILILICSGSLAMATFAHVPLVLSGGVGRYNHTFIAVLYVSGFLYPLIVLLEGIGQKAGIVEGLLGSFGSLAIPVYWVWLLGTIHKISRFRVSAVIVLAFLILGIPTALITDAIDNRDANEYTARARYDQEYYLLSDLLYLEIRNWCTEYQQPRFNVSYYLRGTIHLDLGQLDSAKQYFEQAIELDSENPY